jgi:type VI secretion system protein ImpB
MGDTATGKTLLRWGERTKVSINRNDFEAVLAELNPKAEIAVENVLIGDGSNLPVGLDSKSTEDFSPTKIAERVPELRVLMTAKNLLRDLKSNLLANTTFHRELENILVDTTLSASLQSELRGLAESASSSSPVP